MAKFLHLGLDLPEVVRLSTSSPARLIQRQDSLGSLAVGRTADITIFRVVDGNFSLTDSEGKTEQTHRNLDVRHTVRAGQVAYTAQP